jgi:hypothetical protein
LSKSTTNSKKFPNLGQKAHNMLFDENGKKKKSLDKFVCVLIDPEEAVSKKSDSLIWAIIDELVTEDERLLGYLDYYPPKKAGDKDVPKRHPQTVLNNLLKKAWRDDYKFAILLDEFELIARNEELRKDNFLHYLRGISDNYALAYVTSSRHPLSKVCDLNDEFMSPFENNFAKSCPVRQMNNSECYDLIYGILKKYEYDPNELKPDENKAIDLAGKNPYYLKVACSYLFEWKVNRNESEDYNWQEEFLKEAKVEYERMWRILDIEERDWIFTINKNKVSADNIEISEELASLHNRGVIIKGEDGQLELFSKSFDNYINKYVHNLEEKYDLIEDEIKRGRRNLHEYENLKEIYEHLEDLNREWHDQRQTPKSKVSVKSEHLLSILEAVS